MQLLLLLANEADEAVDADDEQWLMVDSDLCASGWWWWWWCSVTDDDEWMFAWCGCCCCCCCCGLCGADGCCCCWNEVNCSNLSRRDMTSFFDDDDEAAATGAFDSTTSVSIEQTDPPLAGDIGGICFAGMLDCWGMVVICLCCWLWLCPCRSSCCWTRSAATLSCDETDLMDEDDEDDEVCDDLMDNGETGERVAVVGVSSSSLCSFDLVDVVVVPLAFGVSWHATMSTRL